MNIPQLQQLRYPGTRQLMFIGDPHVWSKKPGRRRDVSYLRTVLAKLTRCAEIANQRRAWPLILGDLFEKPDDTDAEMLIELSKVLQKFERKPVTLVGNHDKNEEVLSQNNPMRLLEVTGQLMVIDQQGLWGEIDLEDGAGKSRHVLIGGSPYGNVLEPSLLNLLSLEQQEHLPKTVKQVREAYRADQVVWMTHTDLAFQGAYPGSQELIETKGVDMVVNGHMHLTKTPVKVGSTTYYNPGNITRVTMEALHHVPKVWLWDPHAGKTGVDATDKIIERLEGVELPHAKGEDIFELTGKRIQGSKMDRQEIYKFVKMMRNDPQSERTDDAVELRETMAQVFVQRKTPVYVQKTMYELLEKVIGQAKK